MVWNVVYVVGCRFVVVVVEVLLFVDGLVVVY